jgi:hypothetical protein
MDHPIAPLLVTLSSVGGAKDNGNTTLSPGIPIGSGVECLTVSIRTEHVCSGFPEKRLRRE